ncbi:MAG: tRNA (adenosine(37)-N6)-threonylcarbamoyltransferase complex ATPase subunit type 1 TsaE [Alphaproteobacteria bacterium]|nr:tRNA (adenosine(37)-N6)-threonylcarbamoyltransferase complex ATPase subunit type 1 TsaE [Alphaproteobacteria bacterium]
MFTKTFITNNEQETIKLAERFATLAENKDVFALYGTLGVGKSVFSRAFIQKLTQAEEVPSPTFTLVQSYSYGNTEIYHFDLYRLKSPEEVFELGFEEAIYGGISLIEWPEKAGYLLPKDVFKVNITAQNDQRIFEITVSSPDKAARLEKIDAD